MIDTNIVTLLGVLSMEIENKLLAGDPANYAAFDDLVNEFNDTIVKHPEEAAEYFKEASLIPFISLKVDDMIPVEKRMSPIINPGLSNKEGLTTYPDLYPDGRFVELVYERGILTKAYYSTAGFSLDVTSRIELISLTTPRIVEAWSDFQSITVSGVLAISKSRNNLLSQINLRPLSTSAASFNVFNTGITIPYRYLMDFIPYPGQDYNFEELGFYSRPCDLYNGVNKVSKAGDQYYLEPVTDIKVRGVLKTVIWETTVKGYLYPVFGFAIPEGKVKVKVYDFFQWMLAPIGIDSEVTLIKHGDEYQLHSIRTPAERRTMYIPKRCPSCGSLVAYEGGNRNVLYTRCFAEHNPAVEMSVNMFLRDKFTWVDKYNLENFIKQSGVESLLSLVDLRLTYTCYDVLYGLGLKSIGLNEAYLISRACNDKTDLMALLGDINALNALGIAWMKCLDISRETSLPMSAELAEFIQYLKIDFDTPVDPPKVVGIMGGFKISRLELAYYFSFYGIDLVEEGLEKIPVVISGKGDMQYQIDYLEQCGVMVLAADHYFDLNLLIKEVLNYV